MMKITRTRNIERLVHTEAVTQSLSAKKVFLEISQNVRLQRYEKRDSYRCFPMNFAKFLRAPFLTEHLCWLLLNISFKRLLFLNQMVLIKSFLTGALNDRSQKIYVYLNEGEKAREYCGCLKLMVQAHIHVAFFKILSIKHVSLKRLYRPCPNSKLMRSIKNSE